MPKRLGKSEKRIKTLMEGAGITRVEGKICASHLKHLKEGALIAAYKNGAIYLWEDNNKHYEDRIDKQNKNPDRPVCYLFMLHNGNIVSLGNYLMCDIIRDWRKDNSINKQLGVGQHNNKILNNRGEDNG